MRIAFVAPECDPLVKVGGLGDVVGSLPRALQQLGHEVEVYLPKLGILPFDRMGELRDEGTVEVRQPPLPSSARILGTSARGVPVHLVERFEFFEREPHPYGSYEDGPARFAFFALASLASMARDGWVPDAIHVHDWPTGLLPVYRSLRFRDSALGRTGVVLTIHNVGHPGSFHRGWFPHLGLPEWLSAPAQLEFHGTMSMLKAGILWSTLVTTVSPTYAEEIRRAPLGAGMEDALRGRAGDFVGILNGLDTEVWDPPFTAENLAGKEAHRAALRREMKLRDDPAAPLFGFVSRLDPQKGVGALFEAMPRFVEAGAQLAILGDGADDYRRGISALAARFPDRVGAALEFNAGLARRIYAGSDFFLMPSKFEPCGLAQMIASRFGSIPIVARTGGLADTIHEGPDGNGFVFATPVTLDDRIWIPAAGLELASAVERALGVFADKPRFDALRRRAMGVDFSWESSARKYAEVYAEAARRERSSTGRP